MDQYQSSSLRVATHFVAEERQEELEEKDNKDEEEEEQDGAGPGKHDFVLGGDWQLDVTHLVQDYLRVEDPRVAQLEGRALVGVAPGTTQLQVGVTAVGKGHRGRIRVGDEGLKVQVFVNVSVSFLFV